MNYKVEAWSWCADYCKKNQWNPYDSYFWNKADLEYRRQHNIFEVGDKVVFTDILNSCVVTFESTETDPMQIVWLTYPDGTAGYVFHLNKIKHATDEEIKAGKRLEVNQ